MPRPSYGPQAKLYTQQLLEAILAYANDELDNCEYLEIQTKWQTDKQLIVRTKIRFLEELTAINQPNIKLNKEQIKEALHRLKDFLNILEDNRSTTQGAEYWHFTLKLWHNRYEKEANLKQFSIVWNQRRDIQRQQQKDPLRLNTDQWISNESRNNSSQNTINIEEELAEIRKNLLIAKSEQELRAALYELQSFFVRHPNNIEGKLLKDSVIKALSYAGQRSVPGLTERPRTRVLFGQEKLKNREYDKESLVVSPKLTKSSMPATSSKSVYHALYSRLVTSDKRVNRRLSSIKTWHKIGLITFVVLTILFLIIFLKR
jgi:hypothetical protein